MRLRRDVGVIRGGWPRAVAERGIDVVRAATHVVVEEGHQGDDTWADEGAARAGVRADNGSDQVGARAGEGGDRQLMRLTAIGQRR
jgi:hypothetical protein